MGSEAVSKRLVIWLVSVMTSQSLRLGNTPASHVSAINNKENSSQSPKTMQINEMFFTQLSHGEERTK